MSHDHNSQGGRVSELRWKQRFQNYENSYKLLKKYIDIENPSIFERAGGIQFFEITFELSWKLMKDYLNYQGYPVKSPRETIKQAFQYEIISDVYSWLDFLEDRNLTTHTYDENKILEIDTKIKEKYFYIMESLYKYFKNLL